MSTYTIEANGSGPLVLNGNINSSGDTTLVLSGNSTSDNSVNGAINGASTRVVKTGSGTWRLSGLNSYEEQLRVCDGTLVVAASVGSIGNTSPFGAGSGTATLPVIGSSEAGVTGTAALLLEGGLSIGRGFSVAALGGGASQVVVLGSSGVGRALFTSGASINLGRSVTLQAANSGTAAFAGTWRDAGGNLDPAVAYTVGSAGNEGVVELSSALSGSATNLGIVHGTARLLAADRIASATPVTVGSSLGSTTLDINGLSQTLSNLTFAVGSGTITGGTLRLTGTVAVSGTSHLISSEVSLDAAVTLSGSGELLVSGVVSGTYSIIKNGSGILKLSGSNTYSGTTTINAGTMKAESPTAFGSGTIVVNAGGTLDKNGYSISNTIINNNGIVLS